MGSWFSRCPPAKEKKPDRITDSDRAVLDLKAQRDQLQIHKRKLQSTISSDLSAAKRFIETKKKSLALLALKKKKHHETLIDQCDQHLLKIAELISNVEYAQVQETLVKALEVGNAAMKKMQQEISLDYVERLVEESEEARAYQQEVNAMLFKDGITDQDTDVLADLRRIEEEEAQAVIENVPSPPTAELPPAAQEAVAAGADDKAERARVEKERAREPQLVPA
ncbi:unnamed protein product [Vitrella brassicaformis CCMP3155]|uniref:Charged multivesicular body protein 6 n=2 Tax=Vitrella brassicaformis TaxID=1169539 RepID=A0A0G4EVA5_VITBC|nr:unnamed protein product [Vitrella brassicaformis CCMP3155]|eukprot:CEM02551.1 unnamed protein product [Vitrella brassicaformis CCMP3155]